MSDPCIWPFRPRLVGGHCISVAVEVYDPQVNKEEAEAEYGIRPVDAPEPGTYDAMILAVAHREFKALGCDGIRPWGKPEHVLYDLKSAVAGSRSTPGG
ncbi:UDP binding domain-containing protein [uncultured Halomonas sp.]|uniref:UDP binding domain-containing protein n=1 Tax=uncultured Halomonas sp. TaxID=173971 RepID=UPI00260F5C39|nr:UDP binding domain-containing protein [uncultured Halomonas sp.]